MNTAKNKFGSTVLTAGEGMTIINADGAVIGKVVYLGCNDLAGSYSEITDEQVQAMQDMEQAPE